MGKSHFEQKQDVLARSNDKGGHRSPQREFAAAASTWCAVALSPFLTPFLMVGPFRFVFF